MVSVTVGPGLQCELHIGHLPHTQEERYGLAWTNYNPSIREEEMEVHPNNTPADFLKVIFIVQAKCPAGKATKHRKSALKSVKPG